MTDQIYSAGLALAGAVVGALIGGLAVLRAAALTANREKDERHRERLRSLYADVMLAALRIMPEAFPFRLGKGVELTTKDEIDVLAARLRLERWHEGDHILEELQEVWFAAQEWNDHKDEPERKLDLVDPLRKRVIESLLSLEDEMRAALGIPVPPVGSTFRRNRR